MRFTYVRHNPRLVEVRADGCHAGWLEQKTRKPAGLLGAKRYGYWTGIVAGLDVSVIGSLTRAMDTLDRAAWNAVTVCESHYGADDNRLEG
jgi:hypothetical protein